jgi:hypothetical protein
MYTLLYVPVPYNDIFSGGLNLGDLYLYNNDVYIKTSLQRQMCIYACIYNIHTIND